MTENNPKTQHILDVSGNRRSRNYNARVLFARVLWRLCYPLFRLSPRPFWTWRQILLRVFGAKIGRGAHIYPTARITMPWNITIGEDAAVGDRAILYALGKITLGARSTVSQGAHLCAGTHDITDPARRLLTPPIVIESDAWVCADAFVGPNVVIGRGAILGARAVAMKDLAPGMIAVGNPARVLRPVAAEAIVP